MGQTHREGCGLIVAKGKVSKLGGCQEFDIRISMNLLYYVLSTVNPDTVEVELLRNAF